MWRALTLTQIDGNQLLHDVPFNPSAAIPNREALRKAYWATTYRALGDMLHLVQDMAQPQHTRNDPHSGLGCAYLVCLGGHASYYEHYVDARIAGESSFTLRERFFQTGDYNDVVENVTVSTIDFSDYPVPSLGNYRDFFATATLAGSTTGRGLANYSNQGFFTSGTNIDSNGGGYPSPPPNTNGMQTAVIPAGSVVDATGTAVPGSGWLVLFKGAVQDNLNPSKSDSAVALSSYGAFDQFMQPSGKRQFTLNHYNYDDQARLLIPRAVAYSAGFLDYFFRGELQIALPDEGAYAVVDHEEHKCADTCGFSVIRLKLKNATANNEAMSNGVFVAVAKFHRNVCYQPDLSGDPGGPQFDPLVCRSAEEEITVSDPGDLTSLGAGAEQPTSLVFRNPIPINATDIFLQVVFRGTLGNESDAVVVATKDISEPNYLAFENDLDYSYDDATDTFRAMTPDPTTQTFSTIAVRLNNATNPVATLSNLGVRGYAQLAFLTDLNTDPTEHLVINFHTPGCCSLGPTWTSDMEIAAFASPPGTSGAYDRTARHVAMYRGRMEDYTARFFQGSPYGYAPCAAGDTRNICTSAGLTAVTSANAVSWTINFP